MGQRGHDGKAEAGATLRTAARAVAAGEAVEGPVEQRRREAGTVVATESRPYAPDLIVVTKIRLVAWRSALATRLVTIWWTHPWSPRTTIGSPWTSMLTSPR
jgi:hypothetical protein